MKHALLFVGDLRKVGGGLLVGACVAQALSSEYRVTMLSWAPAALSELDRLYGTSLSQSSRIEIRCAPRWLRVLFSTVHRRHLNLLRTMLLMRIGRRLVDSEQPELVVSTEGETDLGRRLVQYIHYPWMAWPRPEVELRWYHWSPAVILYRRICSLVGGYDSASALNNVSLVNSKWTQDIFKRSYDTPAKVLYPPVIVDRSACMPWHERQQAIVCIGRFSREKRQLQAISIAERLRERGHELSLHLCGLPGDDGYLGQVQAAAELAGPWVSLHVGLPRDRLFELAGCCRYGLHAMIDEHFGIAVVEMLQLGCLPFVHDSGGPREIVGEPLLCWNNESEAVQKLNACLSDHSLAARLRSHSTLRADTFSRERFTAEFLTVCRGL